MDDLLTSPVADVVDRAEAVNQVLGHENRGPVSWRRGFVPHQDPARALPPTHAAWDDAATSLPGLHRTMAVRRALDILPLLPATPDALPDAALGRAATVLGFLGHAYAHATRTPADLPPAVLLPWRQVLRRLGRSGEPVLSYLDLIVANWQHRPGHDALRVPDLRLLVPALDVPAEHVFYLTQLEILAACAPVLRAVARAQHGVLTDDADVVTEALHTIRDVLAGPALAALRQIDPRSSSRTHVDPIAWATMVAPFAVPLSPGVLGPSGTASPVFALLDTLLGRDQHHSRLGQEILAHRAAYPIQWQELLSATGAVSVPAYTATRGPDRLVAALRETVDAYAGPDGFLGHHRRKVFGYLEIAFRVGRDTTIGGFSGHPAEREWVTVDDALEQSRRERPGTGAPTGPGVHRPRWSGSAPAPRPPVHPAELLGHTSDDDCWVAVHGRVLDLSTFLLRHPGGAHVLRGYAGRDATAAFERAHPPGHPAVARLLDRFQVGILTHPALPAGLSDLYTAWLDAADATLELRSTLRLDRSLAAGTTLHAPSGRSPTPYETDRARDTLTRFSTIYLPDLVASRWAPLAAPGPQPAGERLGPLPRLPEVTTRVPATSHGSDAAPPDRLRLALDDVDATLTHALLTLRRGLTAVAAPPPQQAHPVPRQQTGPPRATADAPPTAR